MNKDEKTNIDLDIMILVNKLIENPENTNDVVLYLRGDREFETASVNIKGDIQLMASVFQHHLDNNPAFKQLMLSILGSWMAKNPVDEKMFLSGLEMAKKTFSNN